jgi:hypothetical protein
MVRALSSFSNTWVVFVLIYVVSSCKRDVEVNSTPALFKYDGDSVSASMYSGDTAIIHDILKQMLSTKIGPFELDIYDSRTNVVIDSLIYSPDQARMIVLLIVKNRTSKLLTRDNDSDYYYDAYYLYCSKDAQDGRVTVYDYSGYRLNFFYDREDIVDALHDYCFNRLAGQDGAEYHYNIDDIRFWSSDDFEWVINNARGVANQIRL